ncbi:MAG: hypothetical protein J0I84_09170 [Terrimonas sp.]|nr:hypothetical protein [Terrimonas sp.]OJY94845.1 MAG: hypothetical protein BGP13_14345 [Sphingobacteriales bacterium 40-81]
MLSLKSCVELIEMIDNYSLRIVDRIFVVFGIEHLIHPSLGKFTKDDKVNILLKTLKFPPTKGPFSDSFQLDLLQYMVEHYYKHLAEDEDIRRTLLSYDANPDNVKHEDKFSHNHQSLSNALKRDGYIIKERTIKKMLPDEIEEVKTESELFLFLRKFNFITTLGHLKQAIENHSLGNWAGANGQFRPFIESLLMEICKLLLPGNKCDSASAAINLLSKTANPPFLLVDLNEVEHASCNKPFIEGLWKRLHPEGTHPGLSNEEDSTFRYHITIVVAYSLLKRLSNRTYT